MDCSSNYSLNNNFDYQKIISQAIKDLKQTEARIAPFPSEFLYPIFQEAIKDCQYLQDYLIDFDEKEKIFIVIELVNPPLGGGAFAQIRIAKHYHSGHKEAFKQAKVDVTSNPIINAYHNLRFIHSEGKCWGFQDAPRRLVLIDKSVSRYGYLGQLYDVNYEEKSRALVSIRGLDLKTYYWVDFHQLFTALMTLENKNIFHGDIKPRNILVKLDKDGMSLIHLADMGSAVREQKGVDIKKLRFLVEEEGRSFTRMYTPAKDLELADQFYKDDDRLGLIEVNKKRDVFSMGAVMYEALQKQQHPYPTGVGGHPDMEKEYQPILWIDSELDKLIKEMLDGDYKKRPTATQAFDRFNAFLQSKHPDLLEKINGKIRKHYPGTEKLIATKKLIANEFVNYFNHEIDKVNPKDIEIAKAITNEWKKPGNFLGVFIDLINIGEIDQAIKLAAGVSKEANKNVMINRLLKLIKTESQFDQLMQIIRTVEEKDNQMLYCRMVFDKLQEQGQLDYAVSLVARKFVNEEVLRDLYQWCLDLDFTKALAKAIPNEILKAKVLSQISGEV